MKNKILLIAMLLCLIWFTACKDDDTIDFSNIKNLYEQLLEVVQKCVQGRWKLLKASSG